MEPGQLPGRVTRLPGRLRGPLVGARAEACEFAAATVALAAPATAQPLPPGPFNPTGGKVNQPPTAPSDPGLPQHNTATQQQQAIKPTTTSTTAGSTAEGAEIGYGAAGGVAVAAAGALTIVMVRRRQHLPHRACGHP